MKQSAITSAVGVLVLCLGLGWQSCGYTIGYPVASGIRTVAIEVVDNLSFRQRLERDLTRDLGKKLSELTGYRHAPRHLADAILKVRIVAVRNTSMVVGLKNPAGGLAPPVGEGALDAIATIELIGRRDGNTIVSTRIRDIAEYRSLIHEGEPSARQELVSDLSRKIVLALEGGF